MTEVEAKFLVQNPEEFEQVVHRLERMGYRVKKGATKKLVDRYFDTPERSILRAGWSYRCREQNGSRKLTLKSVTSTPGPVFTRDEIEQALTENPAGLTPLPEGPVQRELEKIVDGLPCAELFRVENRRTIYSVDRDEDGIHLKLGFDKAHVRTEASPVNSLGSLSFSELELELEQGTTRDIELIADALSEQTGLIAAQLSNFERGMQVAGLPFPLTDWPAPGITLGADAPILALVYQHLGQQLQVLRQQQPRAWEGLDPEGVHQMRVAIRRTRSVIRAFRDMLHGPTVAHLNGELRWLAGRLGEVRDADVYWETFHRVRATLSERSAVALDRYEDHLTERANKARAGLQQALAGNRYDELVAELEDFVQNGPTTPVLRRFGTVRVKDGADLYVAPAIDAIIKRGRRITPDSQDSRLHKLRIEGKRLRYLLEFLSEVETKRWRRQLKASRQLQDLLGEHQDACTARRKLEVYAQSVALRKDARETLLAIGKLLQKEDERVADSRGRFDGAWRTFVKRIRRT